jgi:polysaccharide pyruvyl transferase WcaK-like protein
MFVEALETLAQRSSRISYSCPSSITEWLAEVAQARFFVTARLHHIIAAAALSAPAVAMSGNTPKSEAMCSMPGRPRPLDAGSPNFVADFSERLKTASREGAPATTFSQQAELVQLERKNFVWA